MTAQHPAPPTGPYDPMFGLQEKVASLLAPVFQDANTGELFAYQIACRSLQAYEAETRADFVNAGRTIAFSLASMLLLKEAFHPAMQLEDKKRVAIHANALNRSADQAERSMMDRRRYRKAYPTYPVPQQAELEPEPVEAHPAEAPPARAQPAEAQPAEAARPDPRPAPPATPAINRAPTPIRPSAIHDSAPRIGMPPRQSGPLTAPAMVHAFAHVGPGPSPR